MPGPRGEECARCYYGENGMCRRSPPVVVTDPTEVTTQLITWWPETQDGDWCGDGFRPHPDHACLGCDGDPVEFGDAGLEKCERGSGYQCAICHGTGLRPEKEEG